MKVFKRTLSIVLILQLSFVVLLFACSSSGKYEERKETVFGSGIVFEVRAMGKDSKKAIDEMFDLAHTINDNLSITQDVDTPLKRFNQSRKTYANNSEDAWFEVDFYTYDILQIATKYYDEEYTDGYFNVALQPLSQLWKVDSDGLAQNNPYLGIQPPSLPTKQEVEKELQLCDFKDLEIKNESDKYYICKKTNSDLQLDLGGIAKGYLVDKSKDIAKKYGIKSAIINASGQIYFYNKKYDTNGSLVDWDVGITNPRPQMTIFRGTVAATQLADIGIATSGDYERFYNYYYDYDPSDFDPSVPPDVVVPHIIDPKTGLPVGVVQGQLDTWASSGTSVSSATVISKSAIETEVFGTAICAMGIEKGIELLEKFELDGIIFTADYRYAVTKGFKFFNTDKYNGYKEYTKIN